MLVWLGKWVLCFGGVEFIWILLVCVEVIDVDVFELVLGLGCIVVEILVCNLWLYVGVESDFNVVNLV